MAEEVKTAELDKIAPEWARNVGEVLFTEEQIQRTVARLGEQITKDYKGKGTILVVGLLKGCIMFVGDLLRKLKIPHEVSFMVVSSYGHGTSSSGKIVCHKDLSVDPAGRHVLIVEDLVDSGLTLKWVRDHIGAKKPASLKVCVFLDKVDCRKIEVDVDYVGLEAPNKFVVGYGMDFAEEYRFLPFVGVLKPEAYSKKS